VAISRKDVEQIRPLLLVKISELTPEPVEKKDDLHLASAELKKIKEELKTKMEEYDRKMKESVEAQAEAKKAIESYEQKWAAREDEMKQLRKQLNRQKKRIGVDNKKPQPDTNINPEPQLLPNQPTQNPLPTPPAEESILPRVLLAIGTFGVSELVRIMSS